MIQSFHSIPKSKHFKNQSYHSKKEMFCFLLPFFLFLNLGQVRSSCAIHLVPERGGGRQGTDKWRIRTWPQRRWNPQPALRQAAWKGMGAVLPGFKWVNDWSRRFLKQEIWMAMTYMKKQYKRTEQPIFSPSSHEGHADQNHYGIASCSS